VAVFSRQPTLPKEVYQVGDQYAKARNYDKAAALYRDVIANWPGTEYEMWARTGNVRIDILAGDQTAVEPAVDALIADFNNQPELANAVFQIGEEYYNIASADANKCNTPESGEYLSKAEDIWEKIIVHCPDSQSIGLKHAYYFSAVCYRRLGQYDNALAYYQTVVDNWPDYHFAWSAQYLIGSCYENLKTSGAVPESEASLKIEQAYKAVVEKYPDSALAASACMKLSDLNLKRGQRLDAARYLELFLATARPTDPRINSVKARLEQLLGKLKGEVQ
jgi:tetratricopeptide (TPR) repeat protein